MKDIYGLSYLLFKHGSMSHRRLRRVLMEFMYRTVLTMTIHLFFFIWNGFSTVLPYGSFYFTTFMTILSPFQYFIEGVFHIEYGYKILNRIFGEYKFNAVQSLSPLDMTSTIFSAIFDACLFNLFYIAEIINLPEMKIQSFTIDPHSGKNTSW